MLGYIDAVDGDADTHAHNIRVSYILYSSKCGNLSPAMFLQNNDIDITASCILVGFSSNKCVLSNHASPSFWTFLFQDHDERKIQTVSKINSTHKYEATSCIRITCKVFELTELDLNFSVKF